MKNSLKNLYLIISYYLLNYNILFTIYISIIIIASLLFAYKFALMFPNIVFNNYIILKNIPFNHGNLIDNLINNNSYKVSLYGINVYLDRLPFVAFVTIAISKLSSNIYLFLLIKNILFFSLFYYYLKTYYYKNISKNPFFFLIFILFIFFNLYNFQTSLNFVFAEGYLSILLPCLFIILINEKLKNQALIVSIFVVIIFFLKTTMLYVTISISFLFIIFNHFNNIKKYLPFITLFLGMLSWGTFGYVKTGKFPFLNSISSTNQQALSLVLNKEFGNHFPNSIDIILHDLVPKDLKKFNYTNEWEVHDFFKTKNKEYFKKNKLEIVKNIFKKINYILFNINHSSLSFFLFLNKIIFILSIIIFFFKLYKKIINFVDIYFVSIIISNLLPHLIGWVTHKHMVPVFIICNIYVYINALKIFKEIKYIPLNKQV